MEILRKFQIIGVTIQMATKLMPVLIEITCLFATFHYLMK